MRKEHKRNAILLLTSVTLVLSLAELSIRQFLPSRDEYLVWPPLLRIAYQPNPERMPGIAGTGVFSINRQGARGSIFDEHADYRILTIGGSTTECLFLDDSEAWPRLLEDRLNDRFGERFSAVGSVGKSGHNSRHHVVQIEKLLEEYPHIDAVIMLVGVNDLFIGMNEPDYQPMFWTDADYHSMLHDAFMIRPGIDRQWPFYKRSRIWQLVREAKARILNKRHGLAMDMTGEFFDTVRARRKPEKVVVDTVPDLSDSFAEYRRNLGRILATARQHKVRLILMTQPTLWREDLPRKLERLLWMGGIGNFLVRDVDQYYTLRAQAEAMDQYNDVLLGFCEQNRVECVDLAAKVPKDGTVFYDDVHYNESGARTVADLVSAHLLERGF